MAERTNDESTAPDVCPAWCTRRHSPDDHPEDRLHQSPPTFAVLTTGQPWLDDAPPRAGQVVARLVQQRGSSLTWLDLSGEEDRAVGFCVTVESARHLVTVLEGLLVLAEA
jgi:hypothetical protein